jgi:hypothetical protein
VAGRPTRLAQRRGHTVRLAGGQGPVARRTAPDVRPGGRRAAPTGLVRRRRDPATPTADRGQSSTEPPLRHRIRRAVPHSRPVLLPRRPGQRGMARRHERPRQYGGHHGGNPLHRHPKGFTATSTNRQPTTLETRPRPRRPHRDGRLMPTHLGTRHPQDNQAGRPKNQHPIPPKRSHLTRQPPETKANQPPQVPDHRGRSLRPTTDMAREARPPTAHQTADRHRRQTAADYPANAHPSGEEPPCRCQSPTSPPLRSPSDQPHQPATEQLPQPFTEDGRRRERQISARNRLPSRSSNR